MFIFENTREDSSGQQVCNGLYINVIDRIDKELVDEDYCDEVLVNIENSAIRIEPEDSRDPENTNAKLNIYGKIYLNDKEITSGGGGTGSYDDLTEKPQINSVELSGDKSATDLGILNIQEDASGDPYTLPYELLTEYDSENAVIKVNTITLDNNQTAGSYDVVIKSATDSEAGLMSAEDKERFDKTGNNAYNYIKQIADYLFEVQYSTENIDYDYANEYFSNPSNEVPVPGACTAVMTSEGVLRHFDYYYNDTVELVVRRPADAENNIHGSIGVASGFRDLYKPVVESGEYFERFKIVPFGMADGINDQGLYIQQNVVPINDITYDINPSNPTDCCMTMLIRYFLDHCASFDDVFDAIDNDLHIYPNSQLVKAGFGVHFFLAKGTDWRVIEFTADGYKVVGPTGTSGLDGEMPHGVMTNFRTTGLTFTNDNVNWASVEEYGEGVERFDIATTAFTSSKTLETLRSELLYSHLYTDSTFSWRTEESGTVGPVSGHKLTVQDAKTTTYDSDYAQLHTENQADWAAKTRDDGKGCWQTVHSAIYDLTEKSFNIAIQERVTETFDFALEESSGSLPAGVATKSWVQSQDYATNTTVATKQDILTAGAAVDLTSNIISIDYDNTTIMLDSQGKLCSVGGGGATYTATAPISIDSANDISIDLTDYRKAADQDVIDATFATIAYVDSEFAPIDYVDSEFAKIAYVDANLALKANTTNVNAALALKADITYVDSETAIKANTDDVTAALALKQNNINGSNLLDSSFIDDTLGGNKLVTSTQITDWDAKQEQIIAGDGITLGSDNKTISAVKVEYNSTAAASVSFTLSGTELEITIA